jgi:hypothetical protein
MNQEKKVNELTPMEKLMFTITEMKEGTNDTRKKKVFSDVINIIGNNVLDGIEENTFVRFYVMTRLLVVDEMTEEDVNVCYNEATASFKTLFNAQSLFDEEIDNQTKNN